MKKKKNDYSYEYYVHYIDYNRRNDRWIQRDNIILDDENIEIELKKKNKKKNKIN